MAPLDSRGPKLCCTLEIVGARAVVSLTARWKIYGRANRFLANRLKSREDKILAVYILT